MSSTSRLHGPMRGMLLFAQGIWKSAECKTQYAVAQNLKLITHESQIQNTSRGYELNKFAQADCMDP